MQCRAPVRAVASSTPRHTSTPSPSCVANVDRRISHRLATVSHSAATSDSAAAPIRQALCIGLIASSLALMPVQEAVAEEVSTSQRAVTEYIDKESAGSLRNQKSLEDFRQKYNMRRLPDGRLQLRSGRGEWFQCRLDMEVPGSMLLRDSKGYVYAIQTETIQQIDLSDDLVVLMMFADGQWERQLSPVEYEDDKGKTQQLKLEEKEFREVIGLLKEIQDLEEEKVAPAKAR